MNSIIRYIVDILTFLIRPFYGSGIGKYIPFRQINTLYKRLSQTQSRIKETVYGFKIFVQDSTFIEGHIVMYGYWEKNISNLLVRYLQPGQVFLDVGANIGYDSLLASKCVGEQGRVLAIEPSTRNYEKLQKNIELNQYTNITSYRIGLGDHEMNTSVFYSPENPGATSIVETEYNKELEKEDIGIVVFDQYFQDTQVDLIKMDIEGYEFEALLGMTQLFHRSERMRLIFEFSPGFYQYKVDDYRAYSISILNFLKEHSFLIYHIEPDASLSLIDNFEKYVSTFDLVTLKQADIFCEKGYE